MGVVTRRSLFHGQAFGRGVRSLRSARSEGRYPKRWSAESSEFAYGVCLAWICLAWICLAGFCLARICLARFSV